MDHHHRPHHPFREVLAARIRVNLDSTTSRSFFGMADRSDIPYKYDLVTS